MLEDFTPKWFFSSTCIIRFVWGNFILFLQGLSKLRCFKFGCFHLWTSQNMYKLGKYLEAFHVNVQLLVSRIYFYIYSMGLTLSTFYTMGLSLVHSCPFEKLREQQRSCGLLNVVPHYLSPSIQKLLVKCLSNWL